MQFFRNLTLGPLRLLWDTFCEVLHRVSAWRPFWLQIGFYWFIFIYPFRLFVAVWRLGRWRSLFLGLPALLVFILLGWLNHWEWQSNLTISDRYLEKAELSFARGEYAQAEMLLNRIRTEMQGKNTREIDIALARIYQKTGQTERADFLYSALAPDDHYGAPMAHRHVAGSLCEKLTETSSAAEIDRALHHLQASRAHDNDISPEMLLAWARYSIAIRDFSNAKGYLERVVNVFPDVEKTLGTVFMQLGQREQAKARFSRAKKYLSDRLSREPKNRETREDYVSVLVQVGELDEARNVLEIGKEMDPDGKWRSMLAELYVLIHDAMALQGGHSVSELFVPLAKSMEQEPNSPFALNRLMAYVHADVNGNLELRNILSRVVAEAQEPALAHLALGNLCFLEGDSAAALFHLERCVAINPKLSAVLNNLAWLLATSEENQDLNRALAMANAALDQEPASPQFLDTRATILMKMERWKDALADLETAVKGAADPAEVHDKLAEVYDHLQHPKIADQHRQLATEFRNKLSAVKL